MLELEKIISKVNTFLEPFELTCGFGSDFAYYYEDNYVQLSLLVSERDNREFLDSISIHNPNVTMDIFLWSLLHEIGHAETLHLLTDEEEFLSEHTKALCQDGSKNRNEYYKCPDEIIATEWAVNFANENINTLFAFWNELQPLILDFYSGLENAL